MPHGAFTPRPFSLDHHARPAREAWSVDAAELPESDDLNVQSKVILILGEPQLDFIFPLLYSPHLVSSLVLIVTAYSYNIPTNVTPSVAVLRLAEPLSTSESSAPRLVNVLQWADRVASAWRHHPAPPHIQDLSENAPAANYLTPPHRNSWFGGSNTVLPMADIDGSLGSSRFSRLSKHSSIYGGSSRSLSVHEDSFTSASKSHSYHHAFDSLFNFLPPEMSDQQFLKHAILVTTISRSFLTCRLPSPQYETKRERFFSLRSRVVSKPDVPTLPSVSPAHIVHLVPLARATTLIRPLESFCLTFTNQAPTTGQSNSGARVDMGVLGPTPRPFILPPIALGEVLPLSRKWTVADLILCGALDGGRSPSHPLMICNNGASPVDRVSTSNRAWLGAASDIVVIRAGRAFQKSKYVPSGLGRNVNSWYDGPSSGTTNTPSSASSDLLGNVPSLSSQCSTRPSSSSSSTSSPRALPPERQVELVTLPESDTSGPFETVKKLRRVFSWLKR